MKRVSFILFLSFLLVFSLPAQEKKHDKVKNKYQRTEQASSVDQPPVFIHGRVYNSDKEKLQGASVVIKGSNKGVNTNENGEFFLQGLPSGKISIAASFVGYKTKIIDYYLQSGNNDVYFTLDRDAIALEPVTVTAQMREQQVLDIPSAVTVIGSSMLENNDIREMTRLSEFVPGLAIREQTPHRPNYVIRGLTTDEVSLAAQPRVSVYFNNIPVSRPSMASAELYDMDRVEVLKGPQGTLFGRGAQAGVVHFITRKPGNESEGYLTAGAGEFGVKELQGAVTLPVIDKKLSARLAGIYFDRDGYVDNTFGGTLNGKNTAGARASLRFLPFWNTRVDLVVNYQRDDFPGTAFMSKQFPNARGITDIFQYEASLEKGKLLKNYRDLFGTSLEIKRFRNENNYLTSTTSYYKNGADSRWDGDGTAAPAIDMAETIGVNQFTQEIRYNFSKNSRTNGFLGASYWREKANQTYWFGPNEQYISYLLLQMPEYLVDAEGHVSPMVVVPDNPLLGSLAGMPLFPEHEEENRSAAVNQAVDLFLDATWRMTSRLNFTAGVRGTWEQFKVSNESLMTGGNPSTLGLLTQMVPNLFFKPVDRTTVKKRWKALTYRANLSYDVQGNFTVFAGYSKGRRPHVIQFNSAGNSEIMNQEILNSFEAGTKISLSRRLWFDITGFYQLFKNFQTSTWENNNYLIKDAGKATSWGAETSLKAAVLKNLDIFGNYAYIHARFDSLDSQGNQQEYKGNHFRLTPVQSYTVGMNGRLKMTRNLHFFIVPSYSWKSHVWFEDANTPGLEQPAFGMLNGSAGFSFTDPRLVVSVNGTNLLNEKYLISGGNTGSMFGVPTFIPGMPSLIYGKITWKF